MQAAVQSQWNSPIEVINQDEKNQLVYYLDGPQHVLGVYEFKDGKYRYRNEQSVGGTFFSQIGLPFLVTANYFDGVGNIIHGAVTTDRQVDKFVLHYKNGEIEEVTAKNNTFITEFPSHLTVEVSMFFTEFKNAVAYDKHGEVISIWNRDGELNDE
ncbi:hypothetical protein BKP35_10570 [Anaerobacillus arseniciselenatis]|uniref:Uncharacterized protein n=1 Tax=Anaerobacillus arseniciselenatis TaxID=85682 RepID=A0A1S2LJN8_9BACI|nr:hypothetical protein BKP35_10570 [Anaerobacillus arseniciselenatis]